MRAHGIGGYTFLEILVTTSILCLLFIAAPSVARLLNDNTQRQNVFNIQRMLEMTRSQAIGSNRTITLCGTSDGVNCTKNWSSPTIVIFDDRNKNHRRDGDELIYQLEIKNSRWNWKFSDRTYLRFQSDGSPMEFGHLTLCPITKDQKAIQIILNFVGRPYTKDVPTADLPSGETCA